jgi:hypothetical protein
MTLEEEKKMIAEWMGWEVHKLGFYRSKNNYLSWQMWNPQKELSSWSEFFEKLHGKGWEDFTQMLIDIAPDANDNRYNTELHSKWMLISAPSEALWITLVGYVSRLNEK